MAAGCGTGGNSGDVDASNGSADAAPGTPDGGAPPGFTKLIGRTWSLTAGQKDTYKCVRIQIPKDMYIAGFHADSPTGTHHTVVTISQNATKVGEYDCSAGNLDYQMLFASGVGTDDLMFPDGVGVKVSAGSYINLNLHLFNILDKPISGETNIYVKELPSAPDAAHTAEMVFAGTFNINIPSDNTDHTADGGCTLSADANLIALWPHMHQTANHQLVTLTPNGSSTPMTLLDKPYSFSEQKNYPWNPTIAVHSGDKLWVTCTYKNNTGSTEMFGDSSLDEMCFSGIYRYPATGGNLFSCTTGNPF
ncbi:MAG TPA: hypothetical protein VL463_31505 [Kofleriaceae bacterium]|nr:hypothetical protein [Kofleriaceae bacterium]